MFKNTVFLFYKFFQKTLAFPNFICYNIHRKREKTPFDNQSAQSTWILYRKLKVNMNGGDSNGLYGHKR